VVPLFSLGQCRSHKKIRHLFPFCAGDGRYGLIPRARNYRVAKSLSPFPPKVPHFVCCLRVGSGTTSFKGSRDDYFFSLATLALLLFPFFFSKVRFHVLFQAHAGSNVSRKFFFFFFAFEVRADVQDCSLNHRNEGLSFSRLLTYFSRCRGSARMYPSHA